MLPNHAIDSDTYSAPLRAPSSARHRGRSVAQVTHREGLQRLLSTQNSRLDFRSPKLTRAWCMEAV